MELLPLLFLFISQVSLQSIQISQLKDENGFAIIKLEEQKIIENYTKTLHIVNLTEYQEIVRNLNHNFYLLNLKETSTEYKFLKTEFLNLQHTLNSLIPKLDGKIRNKRGLVNALGTTMKFLTGTMDNEDSEQIFKQLQNLDLNTRQITNTINNQIIINKNFEKNIHTIAENVNNQQLEISQFLNKIEKQTNNLITKTSQTPFALQLFAQITLINNHLQHIKDIILLSRLEVLAHDILTEDEIQKFNLTIEDMPYIKSTILFKDGLIIIVLSLPNFTTENYFNALVIPFPNYKHEQLDVPIQNIILKDKEIFEYNNKKDLLKKNLIFPNNNCIKNLLKENNTCNFKINKLESIKKINEELIVTLNLEKIKIVQNCINQEIVIKGNNLIKYSNCNLNIKNNEFYNKIEKYKDVPIIPIVNESNLTKIINNFTLKQVYVNQIENLKAIEYLEYKSNVNFYTLLTTKILILIIILTVILSYCYKHLKSRKNIKISINQTDVKPKELETSPF